MNAIDLISQDLFDKVRSRFSNLEMGDEEGNVTSDPHASRFFDFDFTIEGNNLGRVSISINERGSLKIFYSQGILEGSNPIVQKIWFDFLREMRNFAKRRLLRFDTRDITKNNLDKTDFKYLATTGTKEDNMTDSKMEKSKMFGSSKSSYLPLDTAPFKTRLVVRHNKAVDEEQRGARSRNINAIYIENEDGERFKYPFVHLAGAKAMQRHVANGGKPFDECGNAIVKMSENIAKLHAFKRHVGSHDSMHKETNEIMDRACAKLENLRSHIANLSKQRHYEEWKNAFSPNTEDEEMVLDQATMEDYKSKFTVNTFSEDLSQYFPLIHSIMKETGTIDLDAYVGEASDDEEEDCDKCHKSPCECEKAVKEFAQFEAWANAVSEGKYEPDTLKGLEDLLKNNLTLGVDATSAIEALQGIGIHDETLEKALAMLAKINPETDPKDAILGWLATEDPEAAAALGGPGATSDKQVEPEQPVAPEQSPAPVADPGMTPQQPMPTAEDTEEEGMGGALAGGAIGAAITKSPRGAMSGAELGSKVQDALPPLKEIAEMVKSFYDKETGKFPLGETGVITKVKKEFGDQAGALAERLVNHLSGVGRAQQGQELDELNLRPSIAKISPEETNLYRAAMKDIATKIDKLNAMYIKARQMNNQEMMGKIKERLAFFASQKADLSSNLDQRQQGSTPSEDMVDEIRGPLAGHPYHDKSDAELRYIIKDAGEAARMMKGLNPAAEAKYLDQVNDASTVLYHRKQKGNNQLHRTDDPYDIDDPAPMEETGVELENVIPGSPNAPVGESGEHSYNDDDWYEYNPTTKEIVKQHSPSSFKSNWDGGNSAHTLPNGNKVEKGMRVKFKGMTHSKTNEGFGLEDILKLSGVKI